MSLQVWLPLNGNLNNNGLSPVSITTTNASFQTDGKIGNCLKLGYSADFSIPSMAGAKQISIAYWVKINTATSTQWLDPIHYYSNIEGSTSAGWVTRQEFYSNCTLTGFWFDNGSMSGVPITVGEWTHFAITVDYSSGIAKMYKNGALVKTATTVNTSAFITGNNFKIGENGLDISENDVRIYDHILSAKEVEILARGLILHYPLNGGDSGQTNLCKTTPKSSTPTSYEAFKINLTENLTKGNKYTVQLWDVDVSHTGKSEADLGVFLYWGGGNVSLTNWKGSPFTNGHADYLVSTFTAPNSTHSTVSNAWINVYNSVPSASGTMSISIGRWKLESGEVATSYLPATTDTEYTTYGYNVTTEYDTSGNMCDGVRNGTLVQTADTPRYQTCTTFNGTDSFIESDSLPLSTQTISVWLKTTWSSSSGYRMAMHDKNTGLAIGWSGVQLITYVGTSNGGTGSRIDTTNIWTANTWHHVVVVKTGDNTRTVYIDGVECAASGTNYWGGDLVKLNIGARHINGSYAAYFNGLISDFRAYATQLTQAQVLDLYRSCGSVSDTGRLLTYELVES